MRWTDVWVYYELSRGFGVKCDVASLTCIVKTSSPVRSIVNTRIPCVSWVVGLYNVWWCIVKTSPPVRSIVNTRIPCVRVTLEVISDVSGTRSVGVLVPQVCHKLRKFTVRNVACRRGEHCRGVKRKARVSERWTPIIATKTYSVVTIIYIKYGVYLVKRASTLDLVWI